MKQIMSAILILLSYLLLMGALLLMYESNNNLVEGPLDSPPPSPSVTAQPEQNNDEELEVPAQPTIQPSGT